NPWSRRMTGSSANERSRSSRIVLRWRSSALAMMSRASSSLPSVIECWTASSINAIPESCCTGPSWRNRAMRRRSSCSAAISRSTRSSTGLLVDDRFAQCDRDGMRARIRLELRQDVTDVALHRLLRDEELLGHIGVRHPVREQLEDLALARREHLALVACGEELGHQRRVDVRLALGNLLDRPHESVVRRLLEDVALRTRLEAACEERPFGVGGEDQHLR